jgi:predicted unusual protein kinase regulating ubiquinone biosynthesis (AarF/ABC1/UbiB family)
VAGAAGPLQNEVPPVPYEAARQVITGELEAPPEELYAVLFPAAAGRSLERRSGFALT